MRPRIFSNHLYLVGIPQGISGFRKPPALAVISGVRYRRDFHSFDEAPRNGNLNTRKFRREDDIFRNDPDMTYAQACDYVQQNPYKASILIEESVSCPVVDYVRIAPNSGVMSTMNQERERRSNT